jgi:predicted metal-binding protein
MIQRPVIDALIRKHGFHDYKWIDPRRIVVAQWVRMKCLFGCPHYGRIAACPPNTPPVQECARFFGEYSEGILFHFAKAVPQPDDRHAWTRELDLAMLQVERDVFLAGHPKAFLLSISSCHHCPECPAERAACLNPKAARPAPEGMAVDVFSTVRQYGYPIEVLTDVGAEMNRYGFLLIE